jgi:cation transport regulator ChaB
MAKEAAIVFFAAFAYAFFRFLAEEERREEAPRVTTIRKPAER